VLACLSLQSHEAIERPRRCQFGASLSGQLDESLDIVDRTSVGVRASTPNRIETEHERRPDVSTPSAIEKTTATHVSRATASGSEDIIIPKTSWAAGS
jgi:hypothetical protein